MKTIMLVLDSGFPIRNLLRNEFWNILVNRKDVHLVLFSPVVDKYFLEEFGSENVTIEKRIFWKHNFLVKLLKSTKKVIWSVYAGSRSFDMKLSLKKGFLYRSFLQLARSLPRKMWNRAYVFLSSLETKRIPPDIKDVFSRYNPDLVFMTTIFARNQSIEIEAKRRGIKTVAFVQSWDNPTTKGPMPFCPDKVAVWNETIKKEMVEFHGLNEETMHVVGVPQFDHYINDAKMPTIEEFRAENSLGESRRTLCYTTGTPWTCPMDPKLLDIIYEMVEKDTFCQPCQLIVRTHPNDNRDYSKFQNHPLFSFHSLGNIQNPIDNWGPSIEDMYRFSSLMAYSDVVINVASTTTIDAAAFDTPVVNIAFDADEKKEYLNSVRRYYEYCHYENIVQTHGVSVCYDKKSFVDAINNYLENPELHSTGRKRIVEEQCWKLDGNSGKRLAELVLNEIH